MTDTDRTARIFQQALEVAPEGRAAFLDRICAGDVEFRAEVESLLRHHQSDTLAGVLSDGVVERSRTAGWTREVVKLSGVFRGRRRQAAAWVLAALFLGGIGYWTRARVERSLRAQIQEQLRVVLIADTTALETWMAGRTQEARVWAANPAIQNLAERLVRAAGGDPAKAAALKDSPLQKEFTDVLRPYLAEAASPQDAMAVLADRSGLRVAATHPFEGSVGRESNERAAARLVSILAGRAKFIPPSRIDSWARNIPLDDPRPVIITAAPVRDSNGKVIAVLALGRFVDAGYAGILTVARMGTSGETYAISPEGVMLSPSRFDGIMKKAGLLPDRPEASSILTVQVRDPGGDVTRGFQPSAELEARPLTMIARTAVASRGKPAAQQTGIIMEPYRDYRGIPVLGAWRWFPESDFGVVTEVDADEAFTVLTYVRRAFEVLFALLSVFVVLTVAASATLARLGARETRLGAYTLLRLIGEGGMSKVYLARHALMRRPAAVKVLKAPLGSSREAIVRFEREVQAVSGLTHPNTIQIYDFGRTPDGTFYYAMEYLPGVTLAELVSLEGPVIPSRVVHILKQVCSSLQEAHERGILHRDIKPLNIMLCERGGQCDFVKVLDFGLARQLEGTATLEITSADRLIGTPLYMAPERFADPLAADPRSDIYSIGAVAYFLLTGRPVFQALTALDLQNQVLHAEPERPSRRVPSPISARLEQLVLQSLSKDPANRPLSAAALLAALETLPDVPDWTREQARDWWAHNLPGLLKTPSQ